MTDGLAFPVMAMCLRTVAVTAANRRNSRCKRRQPTQGIFHESGERNLNLPDRDPETYKNAR